MTRATELDRNAETLHASALLDANGREIPITETMIQRACLALAELSSPYPRMSGTTTRSETPTPVTPA